MVGVGVQG